jgi:hypothetical protein
MRLKKVLIFAVLFMLAIMAGCAGNNSAASADAAKGNSAKKDTSVVVQEGAKMQGTKIKITVDGKVLNATLEDNATTRALVKKMPITVKMDNLYEREMCYHYGQGGLPTDKLRSDGYQVGDIIYWPPRGSLVILYAQNGEKFERQQLGHISDKVDMFVNAGSKEVKFELDK